MWKDDKINTMNFRSKKFWFLVVSFLLLVGGLVAAAILVQKKQLIEKKAAGENAGLELPSSLSIVVDEEFDIPVMLNTDGASIVGADIILNFDKNLLQLIDIIPHPENSSLKTFLPLDENGNFRKQEILNQANQSGKIEFGAVSFDWSGESILSGFNGTLGPTNPLTDLRFRTLNIGQTSVSFDFTPGSTTDSNLVKETEAVDILARITDLSLEITLPPTPTPTSTPTPIPTSTPTPTSSPTPTATPTPTSTPIPTSTPTSIPTSTPTPIPPTPTPTSPTPTSTPIPVPTGEPTSAPTSSPTPGATLIPTPIPTGTPTPESKIGDVNGDGKVDEIDYAAVIAHFGEEGTPGEVVGDVNGDGKVDEIDYAAVIAHFGE